MSVPDSQFSLFRRLARLAAASAMALAPLMLGGVMPARAAGVVGNGTPGSCTALALAEVMNSGSGLVTFACGGAPTTIVLTQSGGLDVIANYAYTLDGGGTITLSGGDTNRLFHVYAGGTLTLTNITLSHGNAAGGPNPYPTLGGAVLNDGGRLALINAVIRDSKSTFAAGAIENAYGTVNLLDSLIENNESAEGGGIDSTSALTIVNSTIRGNRALAGTGGGLSVNGNVVILGSQIVSNTANSSNGGGIYTIGALTITDSTIGSNEAGSGGGIYSTGAVTITHSTIEKNAAGLGGGIYSAGTSLLDNTTLGENIATDGGGVYNTGTVTATRSLLQANIASRAGGGIYNYFHALLTLNGSVVRDGKAVDGGGLCNVLGTVTLNTSTIRNNLATQNGGGIYNAGAATLDSTTLSDNSAEFGGGIASGDTIDLKRSVLSGNRAIQAGGGLYIVGGVTTLENSTISANSAITSGGGIEIFGVTRLRNVTLSGNSAATGGALRIGGGRTTNLTNTIVANSPSGGNCSGTITSSKYSIAGDNTCALAGPGDQNNVNPLLTALGNYGGPTLTHMPKLGSLAIDGVLGSDAPSTDQRGVSRPQGSGFDIGAVERQLSDSNLAPRAFLPREAR